MALQTNAFDLGYVSQAVWNDAHGRLFRFSTAQGVNAVLEGVDLSQIRHPSWLLAFHVEPALLLLAPFYLLWPDPRLLLWLQAVAVAAGALPAAWLARRALGGWLAPLIFGLAWLLEPGLEGAVLSDFHMVAIGATLLMLGLYLLEASRTPWALLCLALAALCREDAAVAVACVGIVRGLEYRRKGDWRKWALPAAASLWAGVSIGLIEPLFSGGVSAFSARYAWFTTALSGHDVAALAGWLGTPEVLFYLALQLLAGGVVCLLAPLQLAAALPLIAVNALSAFDWMRSGGGHYSALLAPLLLWAAIRGAQRLKSTASPAVAMAGLAVVLIAVAGAQVWIGVSPLRGGLGDTGREHAAASLAAIGVIPASDSVSATSALYPHVSARAEAYWFPSVYGAEWLALDVAGSTHPLSPTAMRSAALTQLSRPDMELVDADDGTLVMRRRSANQHGGLLSDDPAERALGDVLRAHPEALPRSFYAFALRAGPATPIGPVRFGRSLELVGYDMEQWHQVGLLGSSGTLVTYWRATQPLDQDLRFTLVTTRRSDGAVSGVTLDAAAAPLWYPTSVWRAGEQVRLEMPLGQLGDVGAAGVAVEDRSGRRLMASGPSVRTWEGGTVAAVARLD